METLVIAALITAYLAGLAALFAPCCIGVLLPAYFGSIFRQKRTVLLMTLVFFFGLLVVFLPLGLGMGFLGQLLAAYHDTIYLLAGIFFLLLATVIFLGFHISIPYTFAPRVNVTGGLSVFLLGVFSGIATLCCAPVLAGALALSALPGSILWGGIYSIIYVAGMVSPLFIISSYLDKKGLLNKISILKKELTYTFLKKKITLTISTILSGAIFLAMGLLLLYYLRTDQLTMSTSATSLWINIRLAQLTDILTTFLSTTTGKVIASIALILVLAWLTRKIIGKNKRL